MIVTLDSPLRTFTLSDGLVEFPRELFEHVDSLEVLDLSANELSSLPDDFDRFSKLKVLFISKNKFEVFPAVLAKCTSLEMIGFKSNQIHSLHSGSLPAQTRWLILTDNQLESLPEDIGQCEGLQKLMLSGNRLKYLPESLSHCANLQLLRVAANDFEQWPTVLERIPKLSWLAFSGNPFCQKVKLHNSVPLVSMSELECHEILGQGASGVIHRAHWRQASGTTKEVAVKIFKGEVTSDGDPQDELQICLEMGQHPNLVKPLAQVQDEGRLGLVMALIPPEYTNLGGPPSLESCTRDTFPKEQTMDLALIEKVVGQMSDVLSHLQTHQIMHGDLYAHNVLIKDDHILFGDFGAASSYAHLSIEAQRALQKMENRAFAFFIDDLLSLCPVEKRGSATYLELEQLMQERWS